MGSLTQSVELVNKNSFFFLCESIAFNLIKKDFGLAKKSSSMIAKSRCGTLVYNPPEMILGKHYNHTSDWYSLGVIAFELTTGRVPFYCHSQIDIKKNILKGDITFDSRFHPSLKSFILDLLERNPKKRL